MERQAERIDPVLSGTDSQIEWAEKIRQSVHSEFDRVANAFRQVSERQQGQDRLDTLAIIAILEEKRTEILANDHAGYFIRTWRELNDQVRKLLAEDARFQVIEVERRERKARNTNAV